MIRKFRKNLNNIPDSLGSFCYVLADVTCEGFVMACGLISFFTILAAIIFFIVGCITYPYIFLPVLFIFIGFGIAILIDIFKEVMEERLKRENS